MMMRINKSTTSLALALVSFLAGGILSAATVDITLVDPLTAPVPYPPGLEEGVTLIGVGDFYAGIITDTLVSSGTPVTYSGAAFFCIELEQAPNYGVPTTYNISDLTMCRLKGVFHALGLDNPVTFTNGSYQDLAGSTTGWTTLGSLDPITATAAQLVIWEILYEDPTGLTQANINLGDGDLQWLDTSTGFSFVDVDGTTMDIPTEFTRIAGAAYSYYCPVPEITSPVALIAGGLLFIRRREPRRSRLKKCGASSNQEIAITA